ncbi:MAG: PsbP-related protein [Cyanobacteria bacterium J06623_7]
MKSIVGKILYDRYRIMQQLSQNDWSTVYLAEDLATDSLAQCKIEQLQPQYDHEVLGAQSWHQVRQTFEAQGDILKNASQHPQIPQLLAFFECDREFYLVREYIDGVTLQQKLIDGAIAEAEAIDWLQETLQVLEFIHKLGMAHLNLQPTSLIQHRDGRKFLTDFAAVKHAVLFDRQELAATLNPDFFPPVAQLISDVHSDIYSLGKTIIYALTGKLADSVTAQPESKLSPPQQTNLNDSVRAEISVELAEVLDKMLSTNPQQSYQSASEVLGELDFEHNVVTFPPPFSNGRHSSRRTSVKSSEGNKVDLEAAKPVGKIVWFLLSLPFMIASAIIFVGLNNNGDGERLFSRRNFTEYSNSEYQFSLRYPDTWSRQQIDDPITGEIVVFASPKETDADLFAEKVYIAVEYLSSEPTTLEDYSQTVLNRIDDSSSNDIELYEDFKTKIDDSPARVVIYARNEGALQLRQMEAFTIKNNQVYIAIYTAEKAKFSQFYPTVEKILDSWSIQ